MRNSHYENSTIDNAISDDMTVPNDMTDPLDIDSIKNHSEIHKMPMIDKDSVNLNTEDRDFLDKKLYINRALLSDKEPNGLAAYEKDFEVKRFANAKEYELHLKLKNDPKLEAIIYVGEGPVGVKLGVLTLPAGDELNSEELALVNQVLKKHKSLWMSTPYNHDTRIYDLSLGYEGISKQNLAPYGNNTQPSYCIKTRKTNSLALICYIDNHSPWDNTFCLWINLKKKILVGANWFSIPMEDGGWLRPQDLAFLDESLQKSNPSFLNGRTSIEKLMNEHNLKISCHKETWWITLGPKVGNNYFQSFSINKKNGAVGQPMTGHS